MEKNIDVEVARIDGELKLIDQKLDTIKNNHLAHLKQDIDKITKTLIIAMPNIFCLKKRI